MGQDILDIVEACVATLNLLLVAHIYRVEKREKKKLMDSHEEERKTEQITKNKESWYTEVVIKRIVSVVEDFFCKNNKIILDISNHLNESSELKTIISNFNSDYYDLKHIIIPATKIFDNSLSINIQRKLDIYCDDFTVGIEKSFNKKYVDFSLKPAPDKCMYEILEILYKYDITN